MSDGLYQGAEMSGTIPRGSDVKKPAKEMNAVELSEALEKLAERLNNVIRDCEVAFEGLGYGADAYVVMQEAGNGLPEIRLWFFRNTSGSGKLACETLRGGVRNPSLPLLECSRKMRADALIYLPKLKEALDIANADKMGHVENRINSTREFLNKVRGR
jgi:hypothetical protein